MPAVQRQYSPPANSGRRSVLQGQQEVILDAPRALPAFVLPPGFLAGNLSATKTITTTSTFAVYMGRASSRWSSITLRYRVTTALATITWGEVAIATGTPSLAGGPRLTTRGYTDISAVANSTGLKSTAVGVTGIERGDDVWALIGCQATTAMVVRAGLADDLQVGWQASATARPSTMARNTSFTIEGATAECPWVAMVPS